MIMYMSSLYCRLTPIRTLFTYSVSQLILEQLRAALNKLTATESLKRVELYECTRPLLTHNIAQYTWTSWYKLYVFGNLFHI